MRAHRRLHASAAIRAVTLGLLTGGAAGEARSEPTPPLVPKTVAVHVQGPALVPYDATGLGVASHPVNILLTNAGKTPVRLDAFDLQFDVLQGDERHACDVKPPEDRWPAVLDAGGAVTLEHQITCETALPSTYAIEVSVAPRGRGTSGLRQVLGSFPLTIEPGAAPPVRLPWDPRVYASAMASREARPGRASTPTVRVVAALTNASVKSVELRPARFAIHVKGPGTAPCRAVMEVPFGGEVERGRAQRHGFGVPCDFLVSGTYSVTIAALSPDGGELVLARPRVRIQDLPTPLPPPAGGMFGGR